MRYNNLTFDIRPIPKAARGELSLHVRVHINPTLLPDILDINVFFDAVQNSGRYPLFTCVCGDFGCSGCYVDVECSDDAWTLRNRYDPLDSAQLVEEMWYDISWSQLEQRVLELSETIHTLQQQYPSHIIGVGEMGMVLPSEEKMEAALQAVRSRIQTQ